MTYKEYQWIILIRICLTVMIILIFKSYTNNVTAQTFAAGQLRDSLPQESNSNSKKLKPIKISKGQLDAIRDCKRHLEMFIGEEFYQDSYKHNCQQLGLELSDCEEIFKKVRIDCGENLSIFHKILYDVEHRDTTAKDSSGLSFYQIDVMRAILCYGENWSTGNYINQIDTSNASDCISVIGGFEHNLYASDISFEFSLHYSFLPIGSLIALRLPLFVGIGNLEATKRPTLLPPAGIFLGASPYYSVEVGQSLLRLSGIGSVRVISIDSTTYLYSLSVGIGFEHFTSLSNEVPFTIDARFAFDRPFIGSSIKDLTRNSIEKMERLESSIFVPLGGSGGFSIHGIWGKESSPEFRFGIFMKSDLRPLFMTHQ